MPNPGFALLIVDMLTDFFRRPPLSADRDRLVAGINELAGAFRRQGQPIVWIRQEFKPDLSDAFLDMRRRNVQVTIAGTDGCQVLPELERSERDQVVVKKRYSAFFGTTLDDMLARLNPATLVIAGVNTHACVRMTVIDAYQRDYDVIVASDCTGSHDEEHHGVTARYLDNKIARFLGNVEIIDLLARDVRPANRP